jgi:hypothetical protein
MGQVRRQKIATSMRGTAGKGLNDVDEKKVDGSSVHVAPGCVYGFMRKVAVRALAIRRRQRVGDETIYREGFGGSGARVD